MRVLWYLVGFLREAWGKFGRKLGKNYLILKRLVGETFMNQWKNIYPWLLQRFFSSKGYSAKKQHIHVHFNKKGHTIHTPIN